MSLEGWTERAPAGPRLAALLGGRHEVGSAEARARMGGRRRAAHHLACRRILPSYLGVDVAEIAGQPLTRIVRLEEDEAGEMPLISALAARRAFTGQRARSRADDSRTLESERRSGHRRRRQLRRLPRDRGVEAQRRASAEPSRTAAFDDALDEVLRSPLDRIIESAERIVERADGPLRSDYASYGNDIAAAARHLLSVIRVDERGSRRTASARSISPRSRPKRW